MPGETNLNTLLHTMSPELTAGEFVFCTFAHAHYGDHPELAPIVVVQEREGLTLVVPKAKADAHHLAYASAFRRITLNVHSSLDAVGLTAAFSRQLTAHGISANVVAGYFHDHIFVPVELAEQALTAIHELTG